MNTQTYTTVISEMVDRWKSQGTSLREGNSETKLNAFEARYGMRLPGAFRYMYSLVDGMEGSMDSNLFTLWSLAEIREKDGVIKTADSTKIFFGDFLIDSHRYYLELNSSGSESVFTDEPTQAIAKGFAEFSFLMLTDPNKIGLYFENS